MRHDSCRQCTKRRIKCDKGTPSCAKCIKKDLVCSGIGMTYQFVETTTPETIEASRGRVCDHEGDAFDDASNNAISPGLRLTRGNSTGFVVDESEDIEGTLVSSSGVQQFIDEAVIHRPRQQRVSGVETAQMSKFSLHYHVALYKPGQVMLMDHCKLIILNHQFAFVSHVWVLKTISSRQGHCTIYDDRPRCRQQRISRSHITYGA